MNVLAILRDAWTRGQDVTVHGWVYRLEDGLVRDLGLHVDSADCVAERHAQALARIETRSETK